MRERQRRRDRKSLRKAERHKEQEKGESEQETLGGKDSLSLVYCIFLALKIVPSSLCVSHKS